MASNRRLANEINAGSMADIAFLLLIFFLVSTTITEDKGILVKLPPDASEPSPPISINERNVLHVLINADNELLVQGEMINISHLKERTKLFISNPLHNKSLSENPQKAIISLKKDRGTSYATYIQVYNELKSAYNKLWDEMAMTTFHKNYSAIQPHQVKAVHESIPLVISESEPTRYGNED